MITELVLLEYIVMAGLFGVVFVLGLMMVFDVKGTAERIFYFYATRMDVGPATVGMVRLIGAGAVLLGGGAVALVVTHILRG